MVLVVDDDKSMREALRRVFPVGWIASQSVRLDPRANVPYATERRKLSRARRPIAGGRWRLFSGRVDHGGCLHSGHFYHGLWWHPNDFSGDEGGSRRLSDEAAPPSGDDPRVGAKINQDE